MISVLEMFILQFWSIRGTGTSVLPSPADVGSLAEVLLPQDEVGPEGLPAVHHSLDLGDDRVPNLLIDK